MYPHYSPHCRTEIINKDFLKYQSIVYAVLLLCHSRSPVFGGKGQITQLREYPIAQ